MARGGESELHRLEGQLAAILREYHPGQEALEKIRNRFPKLEDQISILEVMRAVEKDLEVERQRRGPPQ